MRRYFIAGIIIWVPILGTFYVLRFIANILNSSVALLPLRYHPENLLGFHIPGIGIVITVLILFITGLTVSNFLGTKLVNLWDKLLSKIPLVRSIYNALKQVMSTISSSSGDSFRKVLLIEYPRKGVWSIGFQTSSNFAAAPQDDEMLMVFIPTTPNPTSGFLTILPKKEVTELDISVEEGLKMIVSLGVVIPDKVAITPASKDLVPKKNQPKKDVQG